MVLAIMSFNFFSEKDKRLVISHTLGETTENWDGYEGFIDTQMLKETVDRSLPAAHHKVSTSTVIVTCNMISNRVMINAHLGKCS